MEKFIYEWEEPLYQLAFKGLEQQGFENTSSETNDASLLHAFQIAEEITRQNSKTFFFASSLLSKKKKTAIRSLYAFCRLIDDFVDVKKKDPREIMGEWQNPTLKNHPQEQDLIALAWAETRKNFEIPWHYSQQLIEGVSRDIVKNRYGHFDELTQYCYGVASTVGLMSMHIIGFKDESAYTYAIRLGVALQLTNILRDIGEDWLNGRVYLPEAELNAFNLTYEALEKGEVTPEWRNFMAYQINRNRRLYAEAKPGIALLNRDGRFAIAAAAELYENILIEIENNDYNVFTKRASVSTKDKLKKLPGIWHRANLGYPLMSNQ